MPHKAILRSTNLKRRNCGTGDETSEELASYPHLQSDGREKKSPEITEVQKLLKELGFDLKSANHRDLMTAVSLKLARWF